MLNVFRMRVILQAIMLLILTNCGIPTDLKTVNWKGNMVSWSVLDGGATTSYLWKIHYKEKGSTSEHLIFESYSTPYITDISIKRDQLLIHCLVNKDSTDYITLDLNEIKDFIDDPVKYDRTILESSNHSYHEPTFVKRNRESAIKHNLTN